MGLSFSGLNTYTKELIKPLLTTAVLDAKTQQLIKDSGILIPNAKSVVAIPLMDTDAFFQSQSCSFDASGTTTFSQRTITVGKIKVEEKICPKDLEAYFLQEALKAGSTYEDFGNADFQSAYLAKKNARIAAQLETAIWQGDTASGNGNLNKFDGLIKLITNGTAINANVSGFTGIAPITGGITASNVVAATEGIFKAIPVEVLNKGDVKIFVGYDWYRTLIMAYRALNLFAYNPEQSDAKSFILPGTNIEIVAVNGLNSTNKAFAISLSNMALAVDLDGEDESNYKMWYSEDNNDVRFRVEFKIGVNVAYTTEVVEFFAS